MISLFTAGVCTIKHFVDAENYRYNNGDCVLLSVGVVVGFMLRALEPKKKPYQYASKKKPSKSHQKCRAGHAKHTCHTLNLCLLIPMNLARICSIAFRVLPVIMRSMPGRATQKNTPETWASVTKYQRARVLRTTAQHNLNEFRIQIDREHAYRTTIIPFSISSGSRHKLPIVRSK